ncbi:hypothetical protein CHU98_g1421 [Xylaria longipes]|nr:hypothetical protein CHU98_g1421 [Xylaria longipes]
MPGRRPVTKSEAIFRNSSTLAGSALRAKVSALEVRLDEGDLRIRTAKRRCRLIDSWIASKAAFAANEYEVSDFGIESESVIQISTAVSKYSDETCPELKALNDKAVLALSLARCLLVHLWHELWTRGPWIAESIQFLSATNEILDRHHPYVTHALEKSAGWGPQPIEPTVHDLELSVLGFAQLIAEIETGRNERRRIRITVLDAGVDQGNEDIRGLVDEIKNTHKEQKSPGADRNLSIKSFTEDDGLDNFGHGTHVAGLVLQTAPDADLYIAKGACGKKFTKTKAIARLPRDDC